MDDLTKPKILLVQEIGELRDLVDNLMDRERNRQEKKSQMADRNRSLNGKLEEMKFTLRRFKRIIDSLPVGLLILDGDASILDVNSRCADILDHRKFNLIGKNLVDYVAEGFEVDIRRHIRETLESGNCVSQVELIRLGGAPVSVVLTSVRSKEGHENAEACLTLVWKNNPGDDSYPDIGGAHERGE